MKINTTISLDDNIKNKAKVKARETGLSLSSYITTLINKDLKNEPDSEVVPNNTKAMSKDISNGIDDVLNFD